MRVTREFVFAYMALVTILSAALLAPVVMALASRPDRLDSDDALGLTYWLGLVGFLWVVGVAAGVIALRRRS